MNKRTETRVKRTSKKRGIAKALFVAVVLVLVAMMFGCGKSEAVKKDITIEVVNSEKESIVYDVTTEAEFLSGAMNDAEDLEYSGKSGAYGMMVTTINDEFADYDENGAYWSFKVNGEYCSKGVDTQPVNDGDEFVITYTIGI